MKRIVLVAATLAGSLAFAGGGHGGFHGGGGFRGGGGGNFHAARAPSYRSHGSYGWRAPILLAPPRLYVAPRVYPRVSPYPSYGYGYGYGTTYVEPQVVLSAPDLRLLPVGAVMQLVNGQTWATLSSAWFLWDGARSTWVAVVSP